ncbi:hypothetical protein CAPTEDRAFT_224391 [Capitella teleta]|uniref:3-beta hydroxysteroid dehydrogenase/isomerase domain-containing protein n=1 Tax=Capitella teleta TaxID=283909 RepID=R7USS3_CAPTE|nr:hypothetical protein CAPTEDRAFT_224391 [Capitella teleta]|eukprot:ELU09198.1 hypothetical protein CAPTEDRAFT_224391 [Capitella teleta]
MSEQVVMVTGAAGFLGQHIIRELQENAPEVSRIVALDRLPYLKQFDYADRVEVDKVQCDICDCEAVMHALQGVTCVIHCAGVVSVSLFPDDLGLRKVNIEGTVNLVASCLEQGVRNFIYTSTVDAMVTTQPCHNLDESSPLPDPSQLIFSAYGSSKQRAEQYVLACNESQIPKGNKMYSVVLRPTVMYGELDPHFIPAILQNARKGMLMRIGDGEARNQSTYAGNVAWAHVCAMRTLANPETRRNIAGQVFFITDDTPVLNTFDFCETFVKSRGYEISSFKIPFKLLYYLLCIVQGFLWFLGPFIEINLKSTRNVIKYINEEHTFNGNNAREMMEYQPKYDYKESLSRSILYYDTLIPHKSQL